MIFPRFPIRTALIGVSGYGGTHLTTLHKLRVQGKVEITSVTVINYAQVPEKCEVLRKLNCRIYSDYRQMLEAEAGKIDLCCIPTGIGWHSEMTRTALAAGCHVLVEKPAAATVQEIDRMISDRDLAGRMVAVGFQHLYQEGYVALKNRILKGEIGRLREIRVRGSWPRSAGYYNRNDWAGRLKVGDRWVLDSPANNAFAHFLMGALHLAGPSLYESATPCNLEAELYRAQRIETFDTLVARIRTDTAVEILFAVTHCSLHNQDPVIDLLGERGRVCWEVDQALTIELPGKPPERLQMTSPAETGDRMFLRVLEQISGRAPEACRLEEARKHTMLINAVHESIPIHDIPQKYCQSYVDGSERTHVIVGINDLMNKAAESGLLFSELGVPWAKKPAHAEIDPSRDFEEPLRQTLDRESALAEAGSGAFTEDLA